MKITTKEQFIQWIEFNGYKINPHYMYQKNNSFIGINPWNYQVVCQGVSCQNTLFHEDLQNEIIPFMLRNISDLKDLPNA